MLMIKLFEDLQQHALEIEEVNHHAGSGIDLSLDGDFQHIVVPVPGIVVARAEHGAILSRVPLRLMIAVGRAKLDTLI
jgi:hypothetical protein